jgi:hypothetical protein
VEKANENVCSSNQEASLAEAGGDRELGLGLANEMCRGIRFMGGRPCNQELGGWGVDAIYPSPDWAPMVSFLHIPVKELAKI